MHAEDGPDVQSVMSLGKRKDRSFKQQPEEHGVEPYASAVARVHVLRAREIKTAVVSSSVNCAAVLDALGIADQGFFDARDVEILSYRQELDWHRGMLLRTICFEDKQGRRRTSRERRLVSMSDMHPGALELSLTADNWSADVMVRSAIDGRVVNACAKLDRQFNNGHFARSRDIRVRVGGTQAGCRHGALRFRDGSARADLEALVAPVRRAICGVMGPDEFHDAYPGSTGPRLDNDAHTNIMAAWVLARALEVLGLLSQARRAELAARLDLSLPEIARWGDISRRMFVRLGDDGIINQFEGYVELGELDWDGYRARYGNIQRLDLILEGESDSPNRCKLSKQPDVLMLSYLFSAEALGALFERLHYPFAYETIPRNVACYAPREFERLDLRIRYRGHSLDLRLTRDAFVVRSREDAAAPIFLCVEPKTYEFVSDTTHVFRLSGHEGDGEAGDASTR